MPSIVVARAESSIRSRRSIKLRALCLIWAGTSDARISFRREMLLELALLSFCLVRILLLPANGGARISVLGVYTPSNVSVNTKKYYEYDPNAKLISGFFF